MTLENLRSELSDEAVEELESLVDERVEEAVDEAVDEELEQERQRRKAAEKERDALREQVDELRDRLDERAALRWDTKNPQDITVEHPDADDYDFPLGARACSGLTEDELESQLASLLEDFDLARGDDVGDVDDDELLPIQQLARLPEDVAESQLDNAAHANTYRARNVWKDIGDYGSMTPKGLVLRSGELRRVLSALEDGESGIESRTALRVMERIVDLSKGVVEREKRDGEWMLVVPRDFEQRVAEVVGDGGSQSDSVVS